MRREAEHFVRVEFEDADILLVAGGDVTDGVVD
jgi:hypothetical protein